LRDDADQKPPDVRVVDDLPDRHRGVASGGQELLKHTRVPVLTEVLSGVEEDEQDDDRGPTG
jgi:hypothetical protein